MTAPLLNVDEAARRLGITRRAAYDLIWRGDLAAVRVGRFLRVAPEAIQQYKRSRVFSPLPAARPPRPGRDRYL